MIEEDIISLMEQSGIKYEDRSEAILMLIYSIEKGWFKIFMEQGRPVGVISWIVEEHPYGKYILITNLLFAGKGRMKVFSLRRFFKEKFGKINKVQWLDNRKNSSVIRTPQGN